jgi:hypothetical protein
VLGHWQPHGVCPASLEAAQSTAGWCKVHKPWHGHLGEALLGGFGRRPWGLWQQTGQRGAGGGAEDALACSPLCLQPVDLLQRSTA